MYLFELAHWLSTVVDSLVVREDGYKDGAYRGAVGYVAGCLMVSGVCFLISAWFGLGGWERR
jgi:hypothetical protein